MYEERKYRRSVSPAGLVTYEVSEGESDLLISTQTDLRSEANSVLVSVREKLKTYLALDRHFELSLVPVAAGPAAPAVARRMAEAGAAAGVGPMAAVAGAVAEEVGLALLKNSDEVIIENGGDLFIRLKRERVMAILAGRSPLSGQLKIKISPSELPFGIATSSGTVGHSLSFGRADAATIIADSAPLADAVATACGNLVSTPDDMAKAVRFAMSVPGVRGAVVILGGGFSAGGGIEFVE